MSEASDPIEALNTRFAVMAVGNKVVVTEFDESGQIVEYWPFEEFRKLLVKRKVTIGKRKVPLADAWLSHPRGRQYGRLVYAVPGSPIVAGPRDYNGWRGFRVEPKPGDWSLNRAHIYNIICRGNEELYRWVMNWCAHLVQVPGQQPRSAIVMHGGQGAGKGHFAHNMLGALFHAQQYVHLVGTHQLTAIFNDHLSGKVLVFCDEALWGGDIAGQQLVKGYVTEPTIAINRKYIRQVEEINMMHIIMSSNSDFPVRVEPDDRRYCILEVSDQYLNDEAYFTKLRKELAAGGLAAFLHDLQAWTLDDAALRHPPGSEGKVALKVRSFGPEERWMQNWLMNVDGQWARRVPTSALYENYVDSLRRGRAEARSMDGLGRFLHRVFTKGGLPDWPKSAKVADGSNRRRAYEFPSLMECRRAFDKAHGTVTMWPPPDDDEQESLL